MGHKNRGEDPHNGASRNSRKGTHRRKGSGGGGSYFYTGNTATPGCPWCYPALTKRMLAKWFTSQELRLLQ
jgi:hypothetical protein